MRKSKRMIGTVKTPKFKIAIIVVLTVLLFVGGFVAWKNMGFIVMYIDRLLEVIQKFNWSFV